MSKREYPRIGVDRPRKGTKLCNCCKEHARWTVEIQVDWFRGDDEVFLLCNAHHELVKDINLAELLRLKAKENARRRGLVAAQPEEALTPPHFRSRDENERQQQTQPTRPDHAAMRRAT